MVIDDVFLARERARPAGLTLVPAFDPTSDARLLMLARAF
jgi:hypothetical protein